MALKRNGIEDFSGFAGELIRYLGEQAKTFYGKGETHLKFDDDLITEAELHLTEVFRNRLADTFPEHRIFPYDDKQDEYTHEEKRYLWVFDPIDGVANFQAGIPIWGMSMALFENFWPILGMFYMPATGDLFHAKAGADAFRGKNRIQISSQKSIDDESLLLTFSRFHRHYRSTFPGKMRNLGCTAAHICYVGMGRAEAAIIANESYQDLAAAWIILDAAGGKFYKMDGSEFIIGEYLESGQPGEHLLVAAPDTRTEYRGYLEKIGS